MPYLFIILFKINLVLVLFAAAYYLVLRRLTFYVLNRVFLVFGILFSTVYPFIDLSDFFFSQKQINQEAVAKMNQQVTELVPSGLISEYWQWISILFYIGVVFMAFRLLVQFISLYRMHKKSSPGSVADYQVRILNEPVSPFSFWQTVYINPSLHKAQELDTILAHEHIHVKQWHSLDIILAELSVVFYWFNPGVWLMKRAVKENLEFITDERILKKGIDRKTYQYSLLDVGSLAPSVPIVNNFNLSDLKKRIKMMNVKRSSRLTLGRYLFVLPVLLLTTLAFTVTKKDIKVHLAPLQQVLIDQHLLDHEPSEIKAAPVKHTIKRKKEKQVVDRKRDTTNFIYAVNTIFINTDSAYQARPEVGNFFEKVALSMSQILPQLKGKVEGRAIIADSTSRTAVMKAAGIKLHWTDGEKPVIPADEDKQLKTVTVIGFARGKKPSDSLNNVTGTITYVLDGKKIPEEELKKIKSESIKSVKVEKRETSKPKELTVVGRINMQTHR